MIKLFPLMLKSFYENPFMLKYCPDKYITQKMCDEAVDDFLPTSNFVADWYVTSKIIKKLFTALFADENLLSILMKILIMLHLIALKWVFLIEILIILIFIKILMKMLDTLPCVNMVPKLPCYFQLLMEKPLGPHFQVWSSYY